MAPDAFESRCRRAVWRAAHRGTKELDILVGKYADARVATMSEAELDHFERFLRVQDPELQSWLLAASCGSGGEFEALVRDIRAFHGLGAEG